MHYNLQLGNCIVSSGISEFLLITRKSENERRVDNISTTAVVLKQLTGNRLRTISLQDVLEETKTMFVDILGENQEHS